ncbi:IclR family transcriptional regulator [Sneathiella limimaris]|uniref:IclR family transcriptional regulator n=1 Tax=Sneathiella limimaris TaxID=1964213 RepID=UPI00146C6769|nr:helix-turn-helix domain-containing protein [Sneathiella limimaris]
MPPKAKENSGSQARIRQVPALTRGIAILRHLAQSDEPLGVNQIARDTDLIPSTCLHILRTLVEEELVVVEEETKRYSLGIGVLPLARTVLMKNVFNHVVQTHLDNLSNDFGMTSIGVQVTGVKHMVVVAIARSRLPFRLQVDVGSRFPGLISATGRCHAAFNNLSRRDLKRQFDALSWDNPPTYEDWISQIEETKKRGYGIDTGDYIRGVTILSAPVFNKAGAMTNCIVTVGVSEQVKSMGLEPIAEQLLIAARETTNSINM